MDSSLSLDLSSIHHDDKHAINDNLDPETAKLNEDKDDIKDLILDKKLQNISSGKDNEGSKPVEKQIEAKPAIKKEDDGTQNGKYLTHEQLFGFFAAANPLGSSNNENNGASSTKNMDYLSKKANEDKTVEKDDTENNFSNLDIHHDVEEVDMDEKLKIFWAIEKNEKKVLFEPIPNFLTFDFKPFEVEEKFLKINDFDSKLIERAAAGLVLPDAVESEMRYQDVRRMGQSTRGYWNKLKKASEAMLVDEEMNMKNGEENDGKEDEYEEEDDQDLGYKVISVDDYDPNSEKLSL